MLPFFPACLLIALLRCVPFVFKVYGVRKNVLLPSTLNYHFHLNGSVSPGFLNNLRMAALFSLVLVVTLLLCLLCVQGLWSARMCYFHRALDYHFHLSGSVIQVSVSARSCACDINVMPNYVRQCLQGLWSLEKSVTSIVRLVVVAFTSQAPCLKGF